MVHIIASVEEFRDAVKNNKVVRRCPTSCDWLLRPIDCEREMRREGEREGGMDGCNDESVRLGD